MGTRGAFGIKVDGLYKIAYNHSDSYPSGLGRDIAEQWLALRERHGPEKLRELGRKIRLVTTSYLVRPAVLELARAEWQQIIDTTAADHWQHRLAVECLGFAKSTTHRQVASNIEEKLTFAFETGHIADHFSFMADSLFCEWAYIVDLDRELYEVYHGFSTKKHTQGPFAGIPLPKKDYASSVENHYQVRQAVRLPADVLANDEAWCEKLRLAIDLQDNPDDVDEASAHERIEAIAFVDKHPFETWTEQTTAKRAPYHRGQGPRKKRD